MKPRSQTQSPRSQAAGRAADPLAATPYGKGAATLRRLALSGLTLVGLSLALPAAAAEADGLTLSNGWIRFIVPSRPAAGYFTLTNKTDKPRLLTGASSPACGMLMLHESMKQNGRDLMRMVKSVGVPAHGALVFAPGHYHLMCMSPTADVKIGHDVPITLHFGDGTSLTEGFAVRGAASQ